MQLVGSGFLDYVDNSPRRMATSRAHSGSAGKAKLGGFWIWPHSLAESEFAEEEEALDRGLELVESAFGHAAPLGDLSGVNNHAAWAC